MTISHVRADHYTMVEDLVGYWSDEMIECKVEDEPKFKVGDIIAKAHLRLRVVKIKGNKYIVEERPGINLEVLFKDQDAYRLVKETKPNIIEKAKAYWDSIKDAWICPEGYIFKDENGNVINATKIVLEKKKKEYPKTYEECCKIMQVARSTIWFDYDDVSSISEEGDEYECHIENTLCAFRKLLICCDAYWKIAGEEMGLGKPWENSRYEVVYGICRDEGNIIKVDDYWGDTHIFEFPIREMRDTFYENFKEEIEKCKELL